MSRIAHPAGRFITRSFSLPADLNAEVDETLNAERKGITEYIRSLIVTDMKRRWQERAHTASVTLCNLLTGTEWEAFWNNHPELELNDASARNVALALEAAIASQRKG